MGEFFEGVDILLTPAPAGPASTLGAFPTDSDDVDAHVARMLIFSPYTALFNVTGQPRSRCPYHRSHRIADCQKRILSTPLAVSY